MEAVDRSRALNEAAEHYFQCGDQDSAQEVVDAASGLIRYYIRLYGGACDQDDLFQTGCLALMKALKNYQPEQQASFVTYASHCIMGEIRHMVRKEASYYRPGCIVELQFKVDGIVEEYVRREGVPPPVAYIARELNVKTESVAEVMRAGLVSFDEIDTAKIHGLTYESFHLPIEDRLTLAQAARALSDLQRKVLHMLFYRNMSQRQVADEMGISQRRVGRIKERSLNIMRDELGDKPPRKK